MRIIVTGILILTTMCHGSDFASSIISAQGILGPYPYNDPLAVLGEPTQYMIGEASKRFACSVVYGAWNRMQQANEYGTDHVVVTLGPGSSIIVGFDHPVSDDINNPYGIDFIVFSNNAFEDAEEDYLACNSDMAAFHLTDPAYLLTEESVIVSVAQYPNGPWYTFDSGPFPDNDLFPTNSFAWEEAVIGGDGCTNWGDASDPLKPVDPNLTLDEFDGLSAAQVIALYDGSAGGTGFDLRNLAADDFEALKIDPQTGRRWIQYVKVNSSLGGEVDAISDVAACGDYQHPIVPGDINQDCRVDLLDLALMAQNWMVCTWMCL